MLGRKTKNVEAIQKWEDISRDDLVGKHSSECTPKESHSFVVSSGVKVQPWYPNVSCFHSRMTELVYLGKRKHSAGSENVIQFHAVDV